MSSFEPATDAWLASPFEADLPGDSRFIPDSGVRNAAEPLLTHAEEPAQGAQNAVDAAHDAAHEAGREAGRAEARLALDSSLLALESAVAQLASQRSDYLGAQRRALVDLAIEMAEALVGRAVEADADGLSERVARALSLVPDGVPVRVALNPNDHDFVTKAIDDDPGRFEAFRSGHDVTIVAEAKLAVGDALVSSGVATVDARMSALLERLRQELAGMDSLADGSEESQA